MSMNKKTLKAAVTRFLPLLSDSTKTEAEIKETIAAGYDGKTFVEEEVKEIFAAMAVEEQSDSVMITSADFDLFTKLLQEQEDREKALAEKADEPAKYIVKQSFRSKDNFTLVHEVGDDVSGFDGDRLAGMVEKGLVEKL